MAKKIWLSSLSSAALLLGGIHPLELTWLAWFGFLPLFFLFFDSKARPWDILLSSLLTGILYYGIGLYWLLFYEVRIYLLVLTILAPTFAIYFLLFVFLTAKLKSSPLKILAAFFLWIVLHQVYSLTPIGTGAIEVPFYGSLPLLQMISVTGFSALAGIIVGINASLASFRKKRSITSGVLLFLFVSLLFGVYLWGKERLKTESLTGSKIKMALIQHNLPVSGRWNLEHHEEIKAKYRELALEAAKEKPDLIIFPLYNFPGDPLRNPEFFTSLAQETGSYILMATYIPEKQGGDILEGFYNTAILYSPEGKVAGEYNAIQAPPFRRIFEKTGREYKVFETPFGKLGVLLCYEDTNPRVAKFAVEKGADILIALSNPGHFTSTHLPYYHLMQDRLRAIETGRDLIRVSANGYSAYIDTKGRIIQQTNLDHEQNLLLTVKN